MENKSPKKSRTSVRIKTANMFGLMVLAVTFFAFPLTTLARSHENHLGIPGSGSFPFNNPQFQRFFSACHNNGNNPSDSNNNGNNPDNSNKTRNNPKDSNNNGNDPSDSNNNGCSFLNFDPQAFQQQLLRFLQGIHGDIGHDPSDNNDSSDSNDPSNSNSPFDITAFQQQLLRFLHEICTDIGQNNCDPANPSNTTKLGKITNADKITTQDPFKILGVFEQSGQPFGSKPSSQTRNNPKITLVKVKSLKDVQKGFFITGNDSKGNTFIGEVISPNQSPIKQAIGLINGQGKPQIVTLTL